MPLDPGPGSRQPTVRYVDSHIYWSGRDKTVINRRERRGSVLYIYRTVYHHYSPPSGTGGGGNPPSGGGGGASGHPDGRAQPGSPGRGPSAAEVRRRELKREARARQRLLRASGYGVVVDGIWGPRSQSAWRRYQRRRGGSAPSSRERLNQEARELRQLSQRQSSARALGDARAAATRARVTRAQQGVQGLRDTEFQRAHPLIRTPRDVRTAADVEAERHRAMLDRYIPDARTRVAGEILRLSNLLSDPKTRKRTLGGMSASNVRSLLFDPEFGGFRQVSDFRRPTPHVRNLQAWLREHGYEVKASGVLDEATLRGLSREMKKLAREERREAVDHLIDTFYGGAGGDGDLRIAGAINLVGLPGFGENVPKPGELLDAILKQDAVARRLVRAIYRRLSSVQLAQFRGKYLKAGVTAQMEAAASRELLFEMQRDAEGGGFLGTIMGVLDSVSDTTRLSAVLLWEAIKDLDEPGEWFDMDKQEEDRKKIVAQIAYFDYEHRYLGLLTQVLADPLNLVPGRVFLLPFRVTGKLTKGAATYLDEVGYKLSSSGHIVSIPAKGLQLPLRGIELPSRARAAFHAADEAGMLGIGGEIVARLARTQANATRLLADTKTAAHLRATNVLRRGLTADWLPVRVQGVGRAAADTFAPKLPTEISGAFNDAYRTATGHADLPTDGLLDDFVKMRGSLYVNQTGELSQLGAVLEGNLASSIRSDAVRELARERAGAARRALSITDKRPKSLQAEYDRIYDETIEQAGPYVLGYGDPELHAILASRVSFRLKTIRERWFPAFQNRIELALDEAGESLWDETGLWAGADGDFSNYLRFLGSEMFEEHNLITVRNPLFGRYFSHSDFTKYAESELRIRMAQKEAWAARRAASGEEIPDSWLDEQRAEIIEELDNAWQPSKIEGTQGLYTDTRQTFRVPLAYARQYLDLVGDKAKDFFANRAQMRRYTELTAGVKKHGRLAELAGDPQERMQGSTSFTTGGLRQQGGDRDVVIPFGDPTVPTKSLDSVQLDVDRIASYFKGFRHTDDPVDVDLITEEDINVRNFQEVFQRFEEEYGKAYDAVYSQALAREGALYSAMRHSQHALVRGLWLTSEAWLGLWRFFALPLKSGWAVVNHIDNSIKNLLQGLVNPIHWTRAFQGQGSSISSVFEVGWDEIRHATMFFDSIFGTKMIDTVDATFEQFWELPRALHSRIFKSQGVDFPDEMLELATQAREGARFVRRFDDLDEMAGVGDDILAALASFHDRVWVLFGSRPENFAKRALYLSTVKASIKNGKGHLTAHLEAWAKIEQTLFDYSKISTIEDNLRWIFPFVQWSRKNTTFWLKQGARYPVATLGVMDAYADVRAQINADLPEWMQRYAGLRWMSDAVERIPGLSWLAGPLAESATDPINLLSFKNLYRFFKQENPNLPADREGNAFLEGMVGFIEDAGFSMNPIIRKPLEVAGMLDLRSWQSVFPLTSLAEAFTRKYFSERFPNGLNLERWLTDAVLKQMDAEPTVNHAAVNFDQYVAQEMAAQAHRGESVERWRAEKKIRDWLFVQAVVGYFGGLYIRHMSPEDIYYSQLADQMRQGAVNFLELSPEERANYRLWKLRFDRVQFDRYVENLPLVRAYYAIGDYAQAQKFLREHYQILPYVEERNGADKSGLPGYVAQKLLQEQTALAINLFDLADKADLSPETVKLAENILVTRELRDYWRLNRSPDEKRVRMLRGQYFRHLNGLNESYHAIPADDFAAKEGFLAEHPDLVRSWAIGDFASEDVQAIIQGTLADLRSQYFEFVDAGDWDTAGEFLDAFPFTFDKVKDGKYVNDRITGRGGTTQKARDYLRAKPYLDYYFSLAPSARSAWLGDGSPGAQIVLDYFNKYADQPVSTFSGRGLTEHARDFLAARRYLDRYFALPESERADWLHSGSPAAKAVLAYFEKWSDHASVENTLNGARWFQSHNAELAARVRFWREYWNLSPEKRAAYVRKHAAEAGIFVYGLLSARAVHDRQAEWMRRAFAAGLTAKAAHFLYVKPLLDFFFKLSRDERKMFLRATPELQAYFDRWADNSISGDKKLDGLLDRYFGLSPGSQERAHFLQVHPEVQDYFDSKATPEERAMHSLLEVYFEIRDPEQRRQFLLKHPEIQLYFDKRQREKSAEKEAYSAFDDADPRLDPFQDAAAHGQESVERMLERLQRQSDTRVELSTRRERRPAAA